MAVGLPSAHEVTAGIPVIAGWSERPVAFSSPAFVAGVVAVAAGVVGAAVTLITPTTLVSLAVVTILALWVVLATVRWPWFPLALYWAVYSFLSQVRVFGQFQVGPFPVALPDLLVALILGSAIVVRNPKTNYARPRAGLFAVGSLVVLGIVAAVRGLGGGYQLYGILIDLRFLVYLFIGYWAGARLLVLPDQIRIVSAICWMSLAGFILEQAAVSFSALNSVLANGGRVDIYRDIGISYFTGKYGVVLSAITYARLGIRRGWWAAGLFGAGIFVTLASLIRTAWIATIAALIVLLIGVGLRQRFRLVFLFAITPVLVLVAFQLTPETRAYEATVVERTLGGLQRGSETIDTVALRQQESDAALAYLQTPVQWVEGVGLGLAVQDSVHPYQHNSFVWFLSKEGAIGLALFVCAIVAFPLLLVLRCWREASDAAKVMLTVLAAAHVGNVVSGYASGNITNWEYAPLVGMTIAWIEGLSPLSASGA